MNIGQDLLKKRIFQKVQYYQKQVHMKKRKKSPCFEMYRRAHILSNGSVGVCSCRDIEGEIVIGDVNKSSLEDIWKGKNFKNIGMTGQKACLKFV